MQLVGGFLHSLRSPLPEFEIAATKFNCYGSKSTGSQSATYPKSPLQKRDLSVGRPAQDPLSGAAAAQSWGGANTPVLFGCHCLSGTGCHGGGGGCFFFELVFKAQNGDPYKNPNPRRAQLL